MQPFFFPKENGQNLWIDRKIDIWTENEHEKAQHDGLLGNASENQNEISLQTF